MIPVISLVGKSNSGKTTYLEKLLRELKSRGWRVGTIKHHHTPDIEVDKPGKDTWRHAQAGADVVAIACPNKVAVIEQLQEELTLDQVVAKITGVDIIITEGYKGADKPKIEVFRQGVHQGLVSKTEDLIAIVSDMEFDIGVPCFNLEETVAVANIIETKFLHKQ